MRKLNAYVIVNLVFLILIGVGLAYSYFFYPNNHPINCPIKQMTGKNCASCGFSRAFSFYTHFQIKEGLAFNKNSMPVFLFFVFQFLYRMVALVLFGFLHQKITSSVIKWDIVLSIISFLFAFLPLLIN